MVNVGWRTGCFIIVIQDGSRVPRVESASIRTTDGGAVAFRDLIRRLVHR